MKSFAQHIEDLLIQYDCVIVPSLGGFIVCHENSFVRNNQLFAPSSQIRFNNLLTYHDGLLIESYMKEDNISYSKALTIVKEEVNKVTSNLNNGNPVIQGRIGVLVKSSDGNIYLRNNNASFLPDNLGLPVVNLKAVKLVKQPDSPIVINIPKVSHSAFKYASAIAALCVFSLLIPIQLKDSSNTASISFEPLKNINFESAQQVVSNDTVSYPFKNIILGNKKESNSEVIAEEKRYHLIIASLSDRRQAQEFISQQKIFPNNDLNIINSKGRYRISAKSFDNYQKALSFMDNLKEKGIAKSAWILCK